MKNYEAYDLLPSGIMIFKNNKVEYVNQHILDVFNIGIFSMKNSIEIIMKTISIENEDELFYFFSNNEYFTHNEKVIQVERSKYEDIDIFSFTLIKKSLLRDDVFSDAKTANKISIDHEIAEYFKLNNIKKVGVLTFYKGLPLKNIGNIVRVNNDSIEIQVDPKHNISLLDRNDVLIIINKSKSSSAIRGYVERNINNVFTIKDFALTTDDMHLRNNVRIKPEDDIFFRINDREYKIYDLSENGVSVYAQTQEDEGILKKKKSLDLVFFDKTVHINSEYLKTVYSENGEILKIIFNMFNSSDITLLIKNYLMKRQNEIIKEIHNYIKENKLIA